jgi:hypothetical protein
LPSIRRQTCKEDERGIAGFDPNPPSDSDDKKSWKWSNFDASRAGRKIYNPLSECGIFSCSDARVFYVYVGCSTKIQ